jgi:UPF0271 protein
VNARIDLNADCGEGYGRWSLGDDAALIPQVSSANLACGVHAGDPDILLASVRLCAAHGVAVGAQPSLPDRQGFGRRDMQLSPAEAYALVVYQIGAVLGCCRAVGVELRHVKPHGALYTMAARDPGLALAIAEAVRDVDATLILYGLAGSELTRAGAGAGLAVAHEAFVDRRYEADGALRPRRLAGALIDDVEVAIAQALAIVERGQVTTGDGATVAVRADTLCLHGDQPGAAAFALRLRAALADRGITVAAPVAAALR